MENTHQIKWHAANSEWIENGHSRAHDFWLGLKKVSTRAGENQQLGPSAPQPDPTPPVKRIICQSIYKYLRELTTRRRRFTGQAPCAAPAHLLSLVQHSPARSGMVRQRSEA